MKLNTLTLTAAAALATAPLAIAGDVSGKITLKGTPPPGPEMPMKADQFCGKSITENPRMPFYVVAADGGLADSVVVLKNVSGKSTGPTAPSHLIDQVSCQYTPYVSAVQTGQKIAVRNSDPFLHNVHPIPAVPGNPEANKAQIAKSPDLIFTFEKPEPFLKFKCDVHGWMFAYVSVVDHPYFAVTGKDGKFTIKGVPDGKYTVEAKHRKAAFEGVTKDIEVKGGNVTGVDFTFEVK
jgi:plastocyanin